MTRIYSFTTLLRVNTGPPTWWKPTLGVDFGRIVIVRAGWLRACIQIGVGLRRHRDEEEAETNA